MSKRTGRNSPQGKPSANSQGKPSSNSNPLANLPDEQRQEILVAEIVNDPAILEKPEVRQAVVEIIKAHQGPLPPPEDYRAYEIAHPGSADRIISMAEKAQSNYFSLAERRMTGDQREAGRGQICATLIALSGIGATIWSIAIGADWRVSVALCGGSLALVIAPFFRKQG